VIGEPHTIARQCINVGCFEERLRSRTSEEACVVLVGVDEEYVGLCDGVLGFLWMSFGWRSQGGRRVASTCRDGATSKPEKGAACEFTSTILGIIHRVLLGFKGELVGFRTLELYVEHSLFVI
jgi:hypothetical protein